MRICMVVNNMNEFGGLEEFATNLALGVQQQGHQVSVLSSAWAPSNNQYVRILRKSKVAFAQLPKWVSVPTLDWPLKRKILSVVMGLSSPLKYILGGIVFLIKRRSWSQSLISARNWFQNQLVARFEPSRRQPFVRLLLDWWMFRWHPDLLHIHGYTRDLLYLIEWAYIKKIPVVYEEHQTPDSQFDWWRDFSKSINKASTIVAVSEKSAQALREVCGVTQPIEVAYYMVPDPVESGWAIDGTLEKAGGTVNITTNARLYVTKGLTYLLDAIPIVKSVHPNAQFRVYGDGPLRGELVSYAEQLGLDGQHIFTGIYTSRHELINIMSQTDIYVMSSIMEGLPIALLEAMSFGLPVVVTTVGGIPEAITDGVNGMLCPPRDPKCLAEKINALIEDPILRYRLGCEARKSYEDGPFHPVIVSRRYLSIYENVLASHAHELQSVHLDSAS